MTRDRAELQSWYRRAMRQRIEELRTLRGPLEAGEGGALNRARAVGQALRGSGATFGFPDLSAVAAIVETSADTDVLRRVEGLITELRALTESEEGPRPYRAEWLIRAADLSPEDVGQGGPPDAATAWTWAARASGLDQATLASAVACYLGLQVAALGEPSRAAIRLVPEALMGAGRVLPLSEDAETITVATAEPTSLPMELELRRLTGRTPVFAVAPPYAIDAALALVLDDPPPVSVPVRPAVDQPDIRDRSILVVDDEPSARLLIKAMLTKSGYRVVEAADGVEALSVMHDGEPVGLVVADLNMPRMDGLELMWELREHRDWGHLPVIVVTGAMDEILETQLMEEGADDYIRKPLDPRLFLARVEATIRRAAV